MYLLNTFLLSVSRCSARVMTKMFFFFFKKRMKEIFAYVLEFKLTFDKMQNISPQSLKSENRAFWKLFKNSKWVCWGNTTITNCRQPRGTARKSRSTITRHQEDKLSKAISSLFPIKMIAILEWTLSNVQQNRTITDFHNGSNNKQKVNNNRNTALERTAA